MQMDLLAVQWSPIAETLSACRLVHGANKWEQLSQLRRRNAQNNFVQHPQHGDAPSCRERGQTPMDQRLSLVHLNLSEKAPLALRYAKESLNFSTHNTLSDVISNEARLQHICMDSKDAAEGISAFMQKRKAKFKGI